MFHENAKSQQSACNQSSNKVEQQTESRSILKRLYVVRELLGDAHEMASSAADKIVGHELEGKVACGISGCAAEPYIESFLPHLVQIVCALETVASEINIQLSRLHRSF